jgi:hypothetical protein
MTNNLNPSGKRVSVYNRERLVLGRRLRLHDAASDIARKFLWKLFQNVAFSLKNSVPTR